MKKSVLNSAIAVALGSVALSANASLSTGNGMYADNGVKTVACAYVDGNTPPNCTYKSTSTTFTGSWFSMDADGSGSVEISEITTVTATGPIGFGVTTSATGSHPGVINGSESPAFDIWEFFSNTGMHFNTSSIDEVGTHTGTSASLDMSGWRVTWSGIPEINMGGGIQNCGTASDGICGTGVNDLAGTIDNGSSLATITCDTVSCSASSTFVLDYSAVVPLDDASGFGGVPYALHMEGHIGAVSAVPVPAAAWLFGSGLVGLVGVARRKKASA